MWLEIIVYALGENYIFLPLESAKIRSKAKINKITTMHNKVPKCLSHLIYLGGVDNNEDLVETFDKKKRSTIHTKNCNVPS